MTLLDLAKASPLEQAEHPERARETFITLGMIISRGRDRVEGVEDMLLVAEEDKPLEAGEDLMQREHHPEIPETEMVEALNIKTNHPSNHLQIPTLILQIKDSRL